MSQPKDQPEESTFDRLYREQRSPVRQFLQLWLGNSAAADDLMQETFLDFWRRRAAFDPRRNLRAYLFGIARKKAASWWRRNKNDAAASEPVCSILDCLPIRDALGKLSYDLRTLLWLREVEGYSYEELAEILHIPVGTVRSRLHTARQQLRTIWLKGKL